MNESLPGRADPLDGLTAMQRRFVEEYLKDRNATAAIKRAGSTAKDAGKLAGMLLHVPGVASAIDRLTAEAVKRNELSVDWVLQRYKTIADADFRNAYRQDGTFKLPHELDDQTAYAIAGMEIDVVTVRDREGREVHTVKCLRLKRHDQLRALEGIARYFKMFSDSPEPSASSEAATVRIKIEGGFTDNHKAGT